MEIHILDDLIREGKIDEAIEIIRLISENKDESYLEVLLNNLKATDNNILRNEIAIALSDIGNEKAVDILIGVLIHPKTTGSRGTLLYALENFDYTAHIFTIAGFIGSSSLEVSMQAFLLLEYVIDELSDKQKEQCKSILESTFKNTENEILKEALELLE
ncbi:HEAT repeat domain-containing protein [Paenibacillus sp. JSM ZJ436]|uniref:HEAT repeat domain-containing protein n=1 Tax=Paenibacillus sp. JSM ZJ436 TaxID=3376190 RepID=UPI0037B7A2EC